MQSPAEWLASHPDLYEEEMSRLSEAERAALNYEWNFWARPNQIAPEGEWQTWLALAGRGFGKTEAGAQWVRQRVKNGARAIALVAETQKDLEEVMVPRLLAVHAPHERPVARFRPVRLIWPNGAQALGYNGTEPDQMRGPEFDTAWVDELAKYRYARDLWDMLQFTMRLGDDPRVFVSTTPRPIPVLKEIVRDAATVVTKGSTFDNASNLPKQFLDKLRKRYEGTRLGRQELNAEILDDLPGALWTRSMFDPPEGSKLQGRMDHDKIPELERIVVAVDPSGTKGESDDGDTIGIIVAGIAGDRGYVLADRSVKEGPAGWGRAAVAAYHHFGADRIVAETNYGGAMVESVIRSVDPSVSFKEVTASRGKVIRAEPVAALYEQGRVSHVRGADPRDDGAGLEQLEDQLCQFGPAGYSGEGSPDRGDALVWAITDLMLKDNDAGYRFDIVL